MSVSVIYNKPEWGKSNFERISVSGGNALVNYLTGGVSGLIDGGYSFKEYHAVSAGVIASFLGILNQDTEELVKEFWGIFLGQKASRMLLRSNVLSCFKEWALGLLNKESESAYQIFNNKLFIYLSSIGGRKIVSMFNSNEHLVEVICLSCWQPFILRRPKINSKAPKGYFDGSILTPQPLLRDDSLDILYLKISALNKILWKDPRINIQRRFKRSEALVIDSDTVVDYYKSGFRDALHFLKK